MVAGYESTSGKKSDYSRVISAFKSSLQQLKAQSREAVAKAVDFIRNPSPVGLEDNGMFIRKCLRRQRFSDLNVQFSETYKKLSDFVEEQHRKELVEALAEKKPCAEVVITLPRDTIALLISPEVRGIVNQIPLPEDTPARAGIRSAFTAQNQYQRLRKPNTAMGTSW